MKSLQWPPQQVALVDTRVTLTPVARQLNIWIASKTISTAYICPGQNASPGLASVRAPNLWATLPFKTWPTSIYRQKWDTFWSHVMYRYMYIWSSRSNWREKKKEKQRSSMKLGACCAKQASYKSKHKASRVRGNQPRGTAATMQKYTTDGWCLVDDNELWLCLPHGKAWNIIPYASFCYSPEIRNNRLIHIWKRKGIITGNDELKKKECNYYLQEMKAMH